MMNSAADRSHREAVMLIHQYHATKQPFGLLLRNFEVEAYDYFSSDCVPNRDGGTVITTLSGPSSVEKKIACALDGWLPMLTVANPSQLITMNGKVPRLQLPNEGWQQVVQQLIKKAHLIVMDCDAFASGVMWELKTISTLQRMDSTVIILPARGVKPAESTLQSIAETCGAVVKRLEPATKEDTRLVGYKRVAYEDEINFDRLDQSSLFADLLTAANKKSAQLPTFDPKSYANLLNNKGTKLAENKQFTEAFILYAQALFIRRHIIDDHEGIIVTLRNFGATYIDAGEYALALPYLEDSLRLAWKLDHVNEVGMIAAYKGFAHKQLGQHEEAIRFLRAGYNLQSATSSPEEIEIILRQLAEVHHELGEGDEMLGCYRLTQHHHRSSGNRNGELKSTLLMARTYWLAKQYKNALTLFEEGLRLSRDFSDNSMENLYSTAIQKLQSINESFLHLVLSVQRSSIYPCFKKGMLNLGSP